MSLNLTSIWGWVFLNSSSFVIFQYWASEYSITVSRVFVVILKSRGSTSFSDSILLSKSEYIDLLLKNFTCSLLLSIYSVDMTAILYYPKTSVTLFYLIKVRSVVTSCAIWTRSRKDKKMVYRTQNRWMESYGYL